MTVILLLRHGQASFDTTNYDQLCPAGFKQARLTGLHLARDGRRPAAARVGGLRRQTETAAAALEAWAPDLAPTRDDRLDEYPARALFESYLAVAAEENPELAVGYAALRADRRLYRTGLAAVTRLWTEAAEGHAGESWTGFLARARGALEAAVEGRKPDETVALFTSGGVIGAACAFALGLEGPQAGEVAMAFSRRTFNAGITELHYGRSGFALVGFNAVAHLRLAGGAGLLTHR